MPEDNEVEINFDGQHFKGSYGLLLVAQRLEKVGEEMSELTEDMKEVKTEITGVNLCLKSIDKHLAKNGNGGNGRRSLKRDAAIVGGGSGLVGVIVYAEQIVGFLKTLFGGG